MYALFILFFSMIEIKQKLKKKIQKRNMFIKKTNSNIHK